MEWLETVYKMDKTVNSGSDSHYRRPPPPPPPPPPPALPYRSPLNFVCDLAVFYSLQGRTNLPPNKIPWDALQALLSQAIYGGRIDNDFDQVCFLFIVVAFDHSLESLCY